MHPDQSQLADYLSGAISEELAESISRHLSECPECEATADNFLANSDTMGSLLKIARTEDAYAHESELRRLLTRIRNLPKRSTTASSASTPMNVPGHRSDHPVVIRDYRLLERLGEGGMGTVYRALHTKLDRIVAIKFLSLHRLQNSDAAERFEREMKAVGKLNHPNIVAAFDAGEADGLQYLVMEYVGGLNLASLLHQVGPLKIADAFALIRQAAGALEYAWSKGLVHRDIKPSNLMLSRADDGSACVKVLDLGLALLSDDHEAGSGGDLTATGQFMGTVEYMAPEQSTDSHAVDFRADIYSLGATLFKLLTGRTPFLRTEFRSPLALMMAKATLDAPSVRTFRPDLSLELSEFVDRMIARDRTARQFSPGEVAAQLSAGATPAALDRLLDSVVDIRTPDATAIRTASSHMVDQSTLPERSAKPSPEADFESPAIDSKSSVESSKGFRSLSFVRAVRICGVAALTLTLLLFFVDQLGIFTQNGTGSPVADDTSSAQQSAEQNVDRRNSQPGQTSVSAQFSSDHALWFDGTTNFVEIPSLTLDVTRPLTVEAKVRYAGNPAGFWCVLSSLRGVDGPPGITLARSAKPDWAFGIRDRDYRFAADDGFEQTVGHLAGVFDAEHREIRFYTGGRIVSRLPFSPDLTSTESPRHLIIGAERTLDETATYHHFIGLIDEVRISNVARYDENFSPATRFEPDSNTLALYHFDEPKGDVAIDSSGNAHHGKIVGATRQRVFNGTDGRLTEYDRQVIEWIQSVGGQAGIDATDRGYVLAKPADEIPEAPVRLVVAYLNDLELSDPTSFSRFDRLPFLATLICSNSNVDDADIAALGDLPGLRNIYLWKTKITDAAVRSLTRYPNLEILHLTDTAVTDAAIRELSVLRHLLSLVAARCGITDAALPSLYNQSKMEILQLLDTKCTEAGILDLQKHLPGCEIVSDYTGEDRRVADWIVGMGGIVGLEVEGVGFRNFGGDDGTPRSRFKVATIGLDNNPHFKDADLTKLSGLQQLKGLVLTGCQVNGSGFRGLNDVPQLESLYLSDTQVTDEFLTELKRIPKLRVVHLNGTQVTDAGVAVLAEIPRLTWIELIKCNVSDACIESLSRLQNLQRLDVSRTKMTQQGIDALKAAIPHAEVTVAFGIDPRPAAEWVLDIGGRVFVSTEQIKRQEVTQKDDLPTGRFELLEASVGGFSQLTPEDLLRFANLPKLYNLDFTGSNLSGDGLKQIGPLPALELLYAWGTMLKGDDLATLHRFPKLRALHAGSTLIDDRSIEGLRSLTQLEALDLARTQITDRSIDVFRNLTNLQRLVITETLITESAVAELRKSLPDCDIEYTGRNVRVREIAEWVFEQGGFVAVANAVHGYHDVRRSEDLPSKPFSLFGITISESKSLTPDDFARLSGSTGLFILSLGGSTLNGDCLRRLEDLPNLQLLYLWGTGLEDDDLATLSRFSRIRAIHAADTRVTDASILPLANLRQMEDLDLARTRITNASAPVFKQMQNLRRLSLGGTGITAKVIAELRDALPSCKIEY
ncbi:MAG: protein kinase [Planctomycetaceae bacterium]